MNKIVRAVLIVMGILLAVGVIAVGVIWLTRGGLFGPGMFGGRLSYGFGFGCFGIILQVLFWALVIGLGLWLIGGWKKIGRHDAPVSALQPESALVILKKRYARGEITKEQFDEMKRDLEA